MNEHILTLARENAPCYLYEYDVMKAQVETLRQTFPQYDLLYSIKANPFPPVVRALAALGLGADAASAPEVLLSRTCGMAKEDIFFSAAGKSDAALEAAWDEGEIIADSLGEVARIGALCRRKGQRRAIGVRMNPAFGMGGDKQQVRRQRGGSAPAESAAGRSACDGGGHPRAPEVPESGRGRAGRLLPGQLGAGQEGTGGAGLRDALCQLRQRRRRGL